jgi:hypothetical protein
MGLKPLAVGAPLDVDVVAGLPDVPAVAGVDVWLFMIFKLGCFRISRKEVLNFDGESAKITSFLIRIS